MEGTQSRCVKLEAFWRRTLRTERSTALLLSSTYSLLSCDDAGMFWRTDPTGKIQLTGNDNWPQDDAIIRGEVIVDEDGDKWLRATKIKQKGLGPWLQVPQGSFIPFEYDDHYYLEAVQ